MSWTSRKLRHRTPLIVMLAICASPLGFAQVPTLFERQHLTDAPVPLPHRPFDPFFLDADNLIALEYDQALMGCPYENDDTGAIHAYRRDRSGTPDDATDDLWVPEGLIEESQTKEFGRQLSLSGNRFLTTAASFTVSGRCHGEPYDECATADDCPSGICAKTGESCRDTGDCPGTCTYDGLPCLSDNDCA